MSDSEIPPVVSNPASPGFAPMGQSEPSPLTGYVAGPSWQEQDGVLRDLWLQNKTPHEIAEVLNRSTAAIMTRAARLGLPRRSAPGRKPGAARRALSGEGGQNEQALRNTPSRRVSRPADEAAPQASPRVCLMCLHSFQSLGRHNRICPSCKSSSEYVSATSMADIHFPV